MRPASGASVGVGSAQGSAPWTGSPGSARVDGEGRYQLKVREDPGPAYVKAWKVGYVQQCAVSVTLQTDVNVDLTITPFADVVTNGLPIAPNLRHISGVVSELTDNGGNRCPMRVLRRAKPAVEGGKVPLSPRLTWAVRYPSHARVDGTQSAPCRWREGEVSALPHVASRDARPHRGHRIHGANDVFHLLRSAILRRAAGTRQPAPDAMGRRQRSTRARWRLRLCPSIRALSLASEFHRRSSRRMPCCRLARLADSDGHDIRLYDSKRGCRRCSRQHTESRGRRRPPEARERQPLARASGFECLRRAKLCPIRRGRRRTSIGV